jgi:putative hemolysin
MTVLRGKLCVRVARTAHDVAAVMALRRARFGVGEDRFDQNAILVIIGPEEGPAACCFRLNPCLSPISVMTSYSAQFYDLAQIAQIAPISVELGRFCLAEGGNADVLRLAFAAMTRVVDAYSAGLLFGCTSFQGAQIAAHLPALQILKSHLTAHHIGRKSPYVADFMGVSEQDLAVGLRQMPPLLRSYLALGGWVSDHAVQDFDLDTLHVFTGVEIANIPAARAANLRALAAGIAWSA